MSSEHPIARWHRIVAERDAAGLEALLDETVVFHSPVVHTPQRGKQLTTMYLTAALAIFTSPTFRYVREVIGESDAMLEFETEIDGVHINGVDIMRWNESGQIVDFKVMLRPLKAIAAVQQRMGELLQKGGSRGE